MRKLFVLSLFALALFAGAEGQPSKDWVPLNPDADWNNFEADEIVIFQGVLKFEEDPDTISFVQRFNPFKLEFTNDVVPKPKGSTLDVYGRSPVLKEYVGQKVCIKGKRERMEVEGVMFDEIWPTAIRLDS